MTVAGLVLAAGEGRRFGGPKAVALLAGERLVDRAVRTLTEAGCSPVVVVSGAVDLDVPGARVVANPLWRSGMGSSLRAGLADLAAPGERGAADIEATVVLLVDTPWISAEAVRRLVEQGSTASAAIATYDGRRGHPVLLSAPVWSAVAELAVGDTAARAWLQANPGSVVEVDCTGLGSPRDVDRPEDLTGG
jgi:CTP:molybdopterin cytidylyltransferase MocA